MAVHFNPRSIPEQGAHAPVSPHVRPAFTGLANAPSRIESQASDTGGCCGWIGKICAWISSFFSSAPSLPSFEQRVQKGLELIDIAYSTRFDCNPEQTVMACEMRYNDQVEVAFGKMSVVGAQFKDMCRTRLSNLMVSNEHIADGKLTVKSYYCERLPNRINYKTSEYRQIVNFTQMQQHTSGGSSGIVQLASVINDVRQIYHPNANDGVPLVGLIVSL